MLLELWCFTAALLLTAVAGSQELSSNLVTNSSNAEQQRGGRLEVKFSTSNTDFCRGEFGIAEANAACKYLGFNKAIKYDQMDDQMALDCPKLSILFHLTCNESKRIDKMIECEKSNVSSGLSKTAVIAISVGVVGFILGSCCLYFTIPFIGYAFYRLQRLICSCCCKEYQNQEKKKVDKQRLVDQDAFSAKKDLSNA